jgi:uncharacterized membrane protein YphA (DoxX/SURF4 family)
MYVASGAHKVFSLGVSEAERFAKKTGLGLRIATQIVLLAGIWELIGAALVLHGVWSAKGKYALQHVRLGTTMLAIFTILATLIFYVRPFRYQPVLSNLTALAGLLLLPKVCELRR